VAVRRFGLFNQGAVRLDAVTEELLAEFKRWILTTSSEKIAHRRSYRTRAIMRHAEPDRFVEDRSPKNKIKHTEASRGSIRHFLENVYLAEHDIGPATIYHYKLVVRKFSQRLGREAMLTDFNSQTLNKHLVAREKQPSPLNPGKPISPHTLQSRRMALLCLWRAANDSELIDTYPRRIRKIKARREIPDAWTREEVARIIRAADKLIGFLKNGISCPKFWRAPLLTCYDTGFRRGDLLRLRPENIGNDGRVTITMQKTGFPLVRPLYDDAIQAIRDIGGFDREIIFDRPYRVEQLSKSFQLVLHVTGLPVGYREGFQKLRHIKAVLRVANECGYLPAVPRFRMLREQKKIPTFVTPEHFAAIYEACDVAIRPTGFPFAPADWWRALLTFAYMSGWRISEILALRREDLDLDAGTALTRAGDNKGGRDDVACLHPVVVGHLRQLAHFEPVVFPWYHNRRMLWSDFRRIQAEAGVGIRYGFHDSRRAFATVNAETMTA